MRIVYALRAAAVVSLSPASALLAGGGSGSGCGNGAVGEDHLLAGLGGGDCNSGGGG